MLKLIRQAIDFRNRTNRRIAQGIEDGTVYAIRRSTGGRVRNFIILFGAMNLLLWLVGTIFAEPTYSAVYTIFSVWEKPAFIILLIPVVTGMIFAYSLIRAKIPDVEDCELEDGVMASAIYNQRSNRRTLTLLASAAFGVLNAAALILCNLLLTGRI